MALSARQVAVKAIHEDKAHVSNPSIMAKYMRQYAEGKCREQISLCRWWFDMDDEDGRMDSARILNSPMPKFD